MSIRIELTKCMGCGKCMKVCPGNLLEKDQTGKVLIGNPRDCWGCTACLKECLVGAIEFYLGEDIGGNGSYLFTKAEKDLLHWHYVRKGQEETVITINLQEANKY